MNQFRTFIAIDLPHPILESIEKQTSRLRQALGNDLIRWVSPTNMHLTLKFLGNVSASHLDFLQQLISQTASLHPQFDLQIGGIGSFPNTKRPRVLWVGVHAPADLASIQRSIEGGAVRLGYEKEERAFSPHLTIGRVRQQIHARDLQKIESALAGFQLGRIGTARVGSIQLFKSDLHAEGSVYTRLFTAPLNSNGVSS